MRRHIKKAKRRTLLKVSGIAAAVIMGIGGVAFAVLQSQQAKLTGNSIQTATANIQISPDGVNYANTVPGFAFGAIVPGGQAMPSSGYPVYVKNIGSTPLSLKLGVSSVPANIDNVDLTKVHVILAPIGGGSIQNFTLQSLVATASTDGQLILSPAQLLPGLVVQYKLQIAMDSDAISGPGATINNVDFSFSGSTASQ